MPNLTDQARALHAAYQARTSYQVAYNLTRENQWMEWLKWSGYTWTEADLARVIHYLRREIRHDRRNVGALKFSNLIGDPARFEEDLNLAREEAQRTGFDRRPKRPAPTPATPPPEALPEEEQAQLRQSMRDTLDALRRAPGSAAPLGAPVSSPAPTPREA